MTSFRIDREGRTSFDLVRGLDSPEAAVREQAARSIALLAVELGPVLDRLGRALTDESAWVRCFAWDAVRSLFGGGAIRALSGALSSDHPEARLTSATILARLVEAVPSLRQAAEEDDDDRVRALTGRAVRALEPFEGLDDPMTT